MKRVRVNKILLLLFVVVIGVYFIRTTKKPEDYEGEAGPSSDKSETPKLTQEELDAVIKFVRM